MHRYTPECVYFVRVSWWRGITHECSLTDPCQKVNYDNLFFLSPLVSKCENKKPKHGRGGAGGCARSRDRRTDKTQENVRFRSIATGATGRRRSCERTFNARTRERMATRCTTLITSSFMSNVSLRVKTSEPKTTWYFLCRMAHTASTRIWLLTLSQSPCTSATD